MATPSRITSRQNPRVKLAVQLRTGRERGRQGRFLIDGAREILRAIASGVRCAEAFICEELCESRESQNAIHAIHSTQSEVFSVTRRRVYQASIRRSRRRTCRRRGETDALAAGSAPAAAADHRRAGGHREARQSWRDPAQRRCGGRRRRRSSPTGEPTCSTNTIRASLGTVFRDERVRSNNDRNNRVAA